MKSKIFPVTETTASRVAIRRSRMNVTTKTVPALSAVVFGGGLVRAIALAVVMLAGMASVASAALMTEVQNGSFEAPTTTGVYNSSAGENLIPGWNLYDSYLVGGDLQGTVLGSSADNRMPIVPDGLQVGFARQGSFTQVVTANGQYGTPAYLAKVNTTYTLSAYLGIDKVFAQDYSSKPMMFGIMGSGWVEGVFTQKWLVKQDLDLSSITPGTMQEVTMSFSVTPENGLENWNLIILLQQPQAGSLTEIDDVRVDASPVPEPASLAVLGLGLAGVLGTARRRSK